MKEEQPVFKVTDRRLFNADGSPRDVSPAEQPETKPAPAKEPAAPPAVVSGPATADSGSETTAALNQPTSVTAEAPAASSPLAEAEGFDAEQTEEEAFAEAGIPDAADPASFINFAMSIASNAASSLGLMEHPVSGKREVDLELGKHWIDVLGMLQKKTKGNLSPQEEQIVEGWLADLRMQFVSLNSAPAPKAAGFTGRDIIGGK
jgi:hypothetical protein